MERYKDSHIAGEFEGWNGDTVYELEDGSRWQMTSYKYSYRSKYRPKVTIWTNGGQYMLQVEGMSDMVQVRKVQ